MDHHPGGFVDDGEVLIFEEDFERYVLGGTAWSGGRLGLAFNLDCFAAEELLLGLGRLGIDADLARIR